MVLVRRRSLLVSKAEPLSEERGAFVGSAGADADNRMPVPVPVPVPMPMPVAGFAAAAGRRSLSQVSLGTSSSRHAGQLALIDLARSVMEAFRTAAEAPWLIAVEMRNGIVLERSHATSVRSGQPLAARVAAAPGLVSSRRLSKCVRNSAASWNS